MKNDKYYIDLCKKEIEAILNWDKISEWKHRDYDILSKTIYEKTEILLSVSTLKRIFKDDYSSTPHPATLDAFAKFLNYQNWNQYKSEIEEVSVVEEKPAVTSEFNYSKIIYSFVSLMAVILVFFLFFNPQSEATIDYGITFGNKKIVKNGVPNTVVFNYDISSAIFDSAFIQQSWDKRRRIQINIEDKFHTSVYYYPGYHKAKLILDNTTHREHNVHITTDGWQVLARKTFMDLVPVYIPNSDLQIDSILNTSPEILKQNKLDISDNEYYVSYYNVKDFNETYGDNFTLDAEIKNSLKEGGLTGQYSQIIVMTENGRMISTFSNKGLVGNISQKYFDNFISGKKNDLSMFGCDLDKWNKIHITVKNKEVKIHLNENFIFSDSFNEDPGKVIGVHLLFFGCGKAKNIKLNNFELI